MNQFQELKERKVLDKDGKVDAMGPYGRSKLTGQEVAQYFRKNKVKDAKLKKAVEVALDLGGADSVARKEIKKFYGDKVLKSKEVQHALKYANESYTFNSLCAYLQEDLTLVEKNLMPAIEKIVADKGAAKVGGITIDMFTASVVKQVYDKVNDANKKKMEKANIQTLVKLAHKVMGMKEEVDEAANPAQQAAIAIAKKEKAGKPGYDKEGKSLKKEWKDAAGNNRRVHEKDKRKDKKHNVMDSYRQMWEDALDEQVSDITVDPRNKISKSADQNKHAAEIAKSAKRFGLKSSMMGKHVRVKGSKKAVNDFLRIIIGKSSYGDPTEKDMSTPQIDKMLTKGLK
tara:strand:+ start:6337 stop:7365 length:1029 start_codon:yes stop_codon:yes gene_type:complete